MTTDEIKDFRNIINPFIQKQLLEINYEGLGEQDATEFREHFDEILNLAVKTLEQEPCEDAISRQAAQAKIKSICDEYRLSYEDGERKAATGGSAYALGHAFDDLPPVTPQPKTGHCKDCKWWKDSDGMYRRGCGAESQCPINRKEVYEGNGYCYMFEPQKSEGQGMTREEQLDKALDLFIKWATDCDFGYDNIPALYEYYKKDIKDMSYTEGMKYIVLAEVRLRSRYEGDKNVQ